MKSLLSRRASSGVRKSDVMSVNRTGSVRYRSCQTLRGSGAEGYPEVCVQHGRHDQTYCPFRPDCPLKYVRYTAGISPAFPLRNGWPYPVQEPRFQRTHGCDAGVQQINCPECNLVEKRLPLIVSPANAQPVAILFGQFGIILKRHYTGRRHFSEFTLLLVERDFKGAFTTRHISIAFFKISEQKIQNKRAQGIAVGIPLAG